MRILFNDFGGYAFAAQLARQLASADVNVAHCFCNSLSTTPSGNVSALDAPKGYQRLPINLSSPLQKYSFVKRRQQEIEYGKLVSKVVEDFRPDIVVSANTPLDALNLIWRAATGCRSKKVFWLQDVIGLAAKRILSKKIPLIGSLIGQHYVRLEQRLLRQSDLVLPISDGFSAYLSEAKVPTQRIAVFENWAPLDETPMMPKENDWAKANELSDKFVVLYSGTLSMKHDPSHILAVADAIEPLGGLVVVRSQGLGADWLNEQKSVKARPNLIVDGFVAYRDLPASLASADVLLALLEPEAAQFSVPSKVLTYLCAGRAILLVAPTHNLAAKKLIESGGGLVVENDSPETLVESIRELATNHSLRKEMSRKARQFAEREFDSQGIAAEFLQLIENIR